MTRVDIFIPTIDPNADAAKRVTALKDKQGWLLEWEQALRDRATSVTSAMDVSSAKQAGTIAPLRATTQHDGAALASPASGPSANNSPQAGRAANAIGNAEPLPEVVPHRIWNPAAYGYGIPLRSDTRAAGAAMPAVTKYVPLPNTMPTRVHFVLSARGVAAYVRAYGLDRETGESLMRKIRIRLQTLGMRLAKLVVNGSVVWVTPEAVPVHDEMIISRED